jgi:dTDP-4-dehydrorhamnose reductase
MSEQWLVIGGDGLIGARLMVRLVRSGANATATSRHKEKLGDGCEFLDLSDDVTGRRLLSRATVACICAAATSLEYCWANPAASRKLNVDNTLALAQSLVGSGVFVIYLSSNLVYDGKVNYRRAEEPTNPTTEYGRQKAAAEAELRALGKNAAIVRLTKVLGTEAPLLAHWLADLRVRRPIYPAVDIVMAPVSVDFVTDVVQRVGVTRCHGIIQVSATHDLTYAQAALHIAGRLGVDPDLVRPKTATDLGLKLETVVKHTTLDVSRLRDELGMQPPDPLTAIDGALAL